MGGTRRNGRWEGRSKGTEAHLYSRSLPSLPIFQWQSEHKHMFCASGLDSAWIEKKSILIQGSGPVTSTAVSSVTVHSVAMQTEVCIYKTHTSKLALAGWLSTEKLSWIWVGSWEPTVEENHSQKLFSSLYTCAYMSTGMHTHTQNFALKMVGIVVVHSWNQNLEDQGRKDSVSRPPGLPT